MRSAKNFDFSNSESPRFVGRVVPGPASDNNVMNGSGKLPTAAVLALEYGFTDVDGK